MGERSDGSGANVDVSDPKASMDGHVLANGLDTVSGDHPLPTVSALWKQAPGAFRRAVLICLAWHQGFPLSRHTKSFAPVTVEGGRRWKRVFGMDDDALQERAVKEALASDGVPG